jgi:hypothetical protein
MALKEVKKERTEQPFRAKSLALTLFRFTFILSIKLCKSLLNQKRQKLQKADLQGSARIKYRAELKG